MAENREQEGEGKKGTKKGARALCSARDRRALRCAAFFFFFLFSDGCSACVFSFFLLCFFFLQGYPGYDVTMLL